MSRSHQGGLKESEYTHTAGGVDPRTLDRPIGSREPSVSSLMRSGNQDWVRYYEQKDPGTSTNVLHTDEARQTTSLILQEASIMVAQSGDETP